MTDTTQAVITVANYIDGEWSPAASGETIESRDPSTGELVAVAPRSGVEDVERAIAAARATFDDGAWPATSGRERAAILFELARLLREEAEPLARLVAIEMGKPIRYVREREIEPAIDRILFYASAARMIRGEVTASAPSHLLNFILKEPVGVCALITPWNDPVDLPLRKIGAAIATGCTFVLKPASDAPASSMAIFGLLDRIEALPKGVANGIVGAGDVVGEALATDPRVDKISFTGSSEVGRRLMELGARTFKRVSLEAGGKAPVIVFPDANLEKAMDAVAVGIFLYAGQSCTAGSRLLLERSIHDRVPRRARSSAPRRCASARRSTTRRSSGRWSRAASSIGCSATSSAAGRKGRGSSSAASSSAASGRPASGWRRRSSTTSTRRCRSRARRSSGRSCRSSRSTPRRRRSRSPTTTSSGSAARSGRRDLDRAIRVARRLRVGDVWVNTHYVRLAESPFGGVKQSGIGRELGMEGLDAYLESKRVCIDSSPTFHIR